MYPLIKTFKATRIRNAFILNAMVAAFTAVLAIGITKQLDQNKSDIYIFMNKLTPGKGIGEYTKILITFTTTFISSFIVYNLLHLLFGFGAAMIIDDKFKANLPKY
jgi:hypothetical protein